ncbi:hypothetical protein HWV62_20402 [Athelia sp. TMB]|nr:hypothetical protein HWV62_20402 [Athelia sp. TMB]
MSSPTSTAFDLTESVGDVPDDIRVTMFKVEDRHFIINRALLDKETDLVPRGNSPIELEGIKASDFEILLDYLNLGYAPFFLKLTTEVSVHHDCSTRRDEKSLTVVHWAAVIAVCSQYGMQRLLDHACKAFLRQHMATTNISPAGAGFERDSHGMYFHIREKGIIRYLTTAYHLQTEGVQFGILYFEPGRKICQTFFLDRSGALRHAASGLAVDIVDDVPVLRHSRPASRRPNPWSHPLPEFSFINSQIRVRFLSDPSLPSCTDDLYPKDSWAKKNFLLAARSKKDFHMHPISDFSPWIPASAKDNIPYDIKAHHLMDWKVLVEERSEDVGGERTSWEIVPTNMV